MKTFVSNPFWSIDFIDANPYIHIEPELQERTFE